MVMAEMLMAIKAGTRLPRRRRRSGDPHFVACGQNLWVVAPPEEEEEEEEELRRLCIWTAAVVTCC